MLDTANRFIGKRPIGEFTASEILVPLREHEAKAIYETARRLRAIIGQVFRYAIATARADNDPTFGLRGAVIAPKVMLAQEAKLFCKDLQEHQAWSKDLGHDDLTTTIQSDGPVQPDQQKEIIRNLKRN